ncbi:MAG TPA: GDSL-type esterase/lipase family protein [Chthonomonadaceae bacterium]|nr:GDSL-type esterase/lipase family protein [Chthonomonadaceae bacterium]
MLCHFRRAGRLVSALAALILLSVNSPRATAQGAPADWRAHARAIHAKFNGQPGTFLEIGDSISNTMAFWTPLLYKRENASPSFEAAFQAVKAHQRPECWRGWKGPEYGNESGKMTAWALERIDGWLKRLNPEVAVILLGTNDLRDTAPADYLANLRVLIRKCVENGTVPIVTTIPPRHDFDEKVLLYVVAANTAAREAGVPRIDYHAEILKRRPNDWDGALEKFSAYRDYDVPTLISRDGVHPSFPAKFQNDYSPEGLRSCGYALRNYLTLLKYAEVIDALGGGDRPARSGPAKGDADRADPAGRASDRLDRDASLERSSRTAAESSVGPRAARTPGAIESFVARGAANRAVSVADDLTADDPPLNPPSQPWFPKAPPLPAPAGDVIRVSSADALYAAAARVRPGGTILLADGRYGMGAPLEIRTDRVTLRGESGRRERVVLDGQHHGELIRLTACTGVTIADLTVQNVQWNGIKINSETGVQRLTVYNCILHNIWQRFIKGVKVPEKDRERMRPAGFRIQYCLFYNDRPKAYADDPADNETNFKGNYIGGIDTMYPRDWTISDNVFTGIHGRTGECRGAVFLWHDVQHCIVERNTIVDCDSGICLGNSFRPEDVKIHCTGCIVRNNFVTRCHENGIYADHTLDCAILNNTVFDPESALGRLIRAANDDEGLRIENNLIVGAPIRIESQSRIMQRNNLVRPAYSALADPAHGNLRLTAAATDAIDRALPLAEVRDDIDRKPRGSRPDIGAHELR